MGIEGFDSHCHLQDAAFDADRETVYADARRRGIAMMVPGYSRQSSLAAVEFAAQHEACWALVGVHPHDAKDFGDEDEQLMRTWIGDGATVGIGEIGLDYHYDFSPRDLQQKVFARQLAMARDLAVPVSIHSREAEADTLAALNDIPGVRGVLHCFTGSMEFAEALLARGFYISFSGVVTFANAGPLRDVVKVVPSDRLLIETDAPYLAPVPFRGKRNQPLWVEKVAELVALEKNRSTKEVFALSVENTHRVFLD